MLSSPQFHTFSFVNLSSIISKVSVPWPRPRWNSQSEKKQRKCERTSSFSSTLVSVQISAAFILGAPVSEALFLLKLLMKQSETVSSVWFSLLTTEIDSKAECGLYWIC